jgi:hypothetical protein
MKSGSSTVRVVSLLRVQRPNGPEDATLDVAGTAHGCVQRAVVQSQEKVFSKTLLTLVAVLETHQP